MKKEKKAPKKLGLSKETVRQLAKNEGLERVVGGESLPGYCESIHSCPGALEVCDQ